MSELVTHAFHRDAHELELEIRTEDGSVRATAASPDTVLTWQPSPNPQVDGDWAAYLVNRLSDRWGKADDGAVWFEIDAAGHSR